MVVALWTLLTIYILSLVTLALGRIASRRSRPFRRFLLGEQAEDWRRSAGE